MEEISGPEAVCSNRGKSWNAPAANSLQADVARQLVHVDVARGFLAGIGIFFVGAAQLAQVARGAGHGRARANHVRLERLLEVLLDRADQTRDVVGIQS